MTKITTTLFLPEEHLIIANWLNVKPLGAVPNGLSVDQALETLGLNEEVTIHSTVDYAVAAILLERIQDTLPQWASVRDDHVTLGRNTRDRAATRVVELTPRFLMMINWADSAPGYSWPEAYYVTYVPLYEKFIVTASVDSTDVHGVTDFAIGHFKAEEDLLKGSGDAIVHEWSELARLYDQSRWEYLFEEGLIDNDLAEKLANRVWLEDAELDDVDELAS